MRIDIHGPTLGQRAAFEGALQAQCGLLAINLKLGRSDAEAAAVTVVFAEDGATWSEEQIALFARLADEGAIVLPVIDEAPLAMRIPECLRRYNAFQTGAWKGEWASGLVDEVLSHAWLRRRERKVFISYRRVDSGPVANQIYDELTRRGYLTFLDDVSIDKGLDFQRELKRWLNDADLLLALLSPNFAHSRWCIEEIAFARSRSIGLLAVEWPDNVYPPSMSRVFPGVTSGTQRPVLLECTDADERLKLDEVDFDGDMADPLCEQTLTTNALTRLLAACARQRSLAIVQRLEDLVPLARELLDAEGTVIAQGQLGDLSFTDKQNRSCFVRVLPFRPDAKTLREAWLQGKGMAVAGCFYSECDHADERALAMRWLADRAHQSDEAAAHSRIWACVGDKVLT